MGDVTFSETKMEVEQVVLSKEEVLPMFDPSQVSAYRKAFNANFRPAPKPTLAERAVNWFRRTFA